MTRFLPIILVLVVCGCRPAAPTSSPRSQPIAQQPEPSRPATQPQNPAGPPVGQGPGNTKEPKAPPVVDPKPVPADDPKLPVVDPKPPPIGPTSKTSGMSREDFRKKVMTFKNLAPGFRSGRSWNGVNFGRGDGVPGSSSYRVAVFAPTNFTEAFGSPEETETKGTKTRWIWKCRDGSVAVILEGYAIGSEKLGFMGVDDL